MTFSPGLRGVRPLFPSDLRCPVPLRHPFDRRVPGCGPDLPRRQRAMRKRLPQGMGGTARPGYRYSPDIGEHAGHVVEYVSDDGVTMVGAQRRGRLVRCLDCLQSWTFAL